MKKLKVILFAIGAVSLMTSCGSANYGKAGCYWSNVEQETIKKDIQKEEESVQQVNRAK